MYNNCPKLFVCLASKPRLPSSILLKDPKGRAATVSGDCGMARQATWADLSENLTSEDEAEDMLRWARTMAKSIVGTEAQSTEIASPVNSSKMRQNKKEGGSKRNGKKYRWVKKKPLPTAQGEDDGVAAHAFGADLTGAASSELPSSPLSLLRPGHATCGQDVWHSAQHLQEGAEAWRMRGTGLQPDALLSMGSAAGCTQYSGWLLDLEIQSYICAVMQPDSHLRWGRLTVWQRDLQHRSADRQFPCPFWHAVLFDLDLGLHVEVEAFVRVLLAGEWSLAIMKPWQRRLRTLTRRLWFPQRLWYDVIHRLNLRAHEPHVRLALGKLLREHTNASLRRNVQ